MKYGNCLVGALILMLRFRTWRIYKIKTTKPDGTPSGWPHFIVKTKDGYWHYKKIQWLLPHPFTFLLFKGKFEQYGID